MDSLRSTHPLCGWLQLRGRAGYAGVALRPFLARHKRPVSGAKKNRFRLGPSCGSSRRVLAAERVFFGLTSGSARCYRCTALSSSPSPQAVLSPRMAPLSRFTAPLPSPSRRSQRSRDRLAHCLAFAAGSTLLPSPVILASSLLLLPSIIRASIQPSISSAPALPASQIHLAGGSSRVAGKR